MINENRPNENNKSDDDALGVDCVSFDSKFFFIIMLPLSIPLTNIFLLLCFSLLLRSTHSYIHRHAIHGQEITDERYEREYNIISIRNHVILSFSFFLSSQSNQISFSLLNMSFSHMKKEQRDNLLSHPLT